MYGQGSSFGHVHTGTVAALKEGSLGIWRYCLQESDEEGKFRIRTLPEMSLDCRFVGGHGGVPGGGRNSLGSASTKEKEGHLGVREDERHCFITVTFNNFSRWHMSELGRSAKGAHFVAVSVQGGCTNSIPPLEPHWRGPAYILWAAQKLSEQS